MREKSEARSRKLALQPAVLKELKNLPPKHCKQGALAILGLLQNATPHDSAALAGHHPWHRIDVGEYRVVYRFDADTVYVPLIAKRNDDEVYKLLRRS
jgi:mRNA interferase RelE/StbE